VGLSKKASYVKRQKGRSMRAAFFIGAMRC